MIALTRACKEDTGFQIIDVIALPCIRTPSLVFHLIPAISDLRSPIRKN